MKDAKSLGFEFEIKGFRNFNTQDKSLSSRTLSIDPVPKEVYANSFRKVVEEIYKGNTFAQPNFSSAIHANLKLEDVFHYAKAPYKLIHKNRFVVYSPECFIKIQDGYIYSYPMKGTINAQLPNAKKILKTDPKEINEHNTIVDLIRNDLSKVAKHVKVTRFRYLDKIITQKNEIYHTSSEIKGKLSPIGKTGWLISY